MHTMVLNILVYKVWHSTIYTLYNKVIKLSHKSKIGLIEIDMYKPTSCDFYATYFMINLSHLVVSLLMIIDGFSYDWYNENHFDFVYWHD